MDISAISAASIDMSTAKAQQSVDIYVAGEVMDLVENQAAQMLADLQKTISSFEHNFDVSV